MIKVRYFIRATPATIGVNVRTIDTNRARTIERGPYLWKNSWAFSTFSRLKSFESGRLNSDGPTLRPNRKPAWSPNTAAIHRSRHTSHSGCEMYLPSETSSPVVNRSESPGRKKPINRPDSAKTITRMPMRPKVEISLSGSKKDGPRARVFTARASWSGRGKASEVPRPGHGSAKRVPAEGNERCRARVPG